MRLVVKCASGRTHPERWAALREATESDSRIVLLDVLLEHDALHGLQSVCDAYVSLHRSEGLGLGMAECMALGKPVIATGYSGNLEFMNHGNSCLVDFRMVPVAARRIHLLRGPVVLGRSRRRTMQPISCARSLPTTNSGTLSHARRNRIWRSRFNEAATVAAIRKRFAELDIEVPDAAARTAARA